MALAYDPLFITSDKSAMDVPSTPPPMMLTQDELKRIAAYKAVDFVESGMVLGLGTGSTAKHAVAYLDKRILMAEVEQNFPDPKATGTPPA